MRSDAHPTIASVLLTNRADEEALRARQSRSIPLTRDGYTIRCRNGLIASMYTFPSRPFGFTRTAIWPR
jgi:hypothetical protein